jgi:hypothetical protein
MRIAVECYAGHRGEETPRRLLFDGRGLDVARVLDRWLAPDHRYFKLLGADGALWIVRHDVRTGTWELVSFKAEGGEEEVSMLEIAVETVCEIIEKVRMFDSDIEVPDDEPEEAAADDEIGEGELEARLAEYREDPQYAGLVAAIEELNVDEQTELVALAWLGRGDFAAEEWPAALAEARGARTGHTAAYLLGMPMVGDYLEEDLAALGYSCED